MSGDFSVQNPHATLLSSGSSTYPASMVFPSNSQVASASEAIASGRLGASLDVSSGRQRASTKKYRPSFCFIQGQSLFLWSLQAVEPFILSFHHSPMSSQGRICLVIGKIIHPTSNRSKQIPLHLCSSSSLNPMCLHLIWGLCIAFCFCVQFQSPRNERNSLILVTLQ